MYVINNNRVITILQDTLPTHIPPQISFGCLILHELATNKTNVDYEDFRSLIYLLIIVSIFYQPERFAPICYLVHFSVEKS